MSVDRVRNILCERDRRLRKRKTTPYNLWYRMQPQLNPRGILLPPQNSIEKLPKSTLPYQNYGQISD